MNWNGIRARDERSDRKSNGRLVTKVVFFRLFDPQFGAFLTYLLFTCFLAVPVTAGAQSVCSSDGQAKPLQLVERFIDADCLTCWNSSTQTEARASPERPSDLTLDWIVPSAKGEDAALSVAATRDATQRLQHLKRVLNAPQLTVRSSAGQQPLRVARGFALNGYMGASIELKLPKTSPLRQQTLTAWLLLVQEISAGTEGSPIARLLVRNTLVTTWTPAQSNNPDTQRLLESRPMSLPESGNPDQMRVVGWVEDASGRLLSVASSRCMP